MNFLSHYYFDRYNPSAYETIGAILPDLVKNANKDWNFQPQKQEELFSPEEPELNEFLKGWKKHLAVDKLFHSADFFEQHCHQLKEVLKPDFTGSAVRPSFLAHIGIELLLDHLLIENREVNLNRFYEQLGEADEKMLESFLVRCGCNDTAQFFRFFHNFKSARYLFSYQKPENISYAMQRICMRIWPESFSDDTAIALTAKLEDYKGILKKDYRLIFETIERLL